MKPNKLVYLLTKIQIFQFILLQYNNLSQWNCKQLSFHLCILFLLRSFTSEVNWMRVASYTCIRSHKTSIYGNFHEIFHAIQIAAKKENHSKTKHRQSSSSSGSVITMVMRDLLFSILIIIYNDALTDNSHSSFVEYHRSQWMCFSVNKRI